MKEKKKKIGKCHGLTLLNIKSEDTMACCAQQIMYRMTKGIRFLL